MSKSNGRLGMTIDRRHRVLYVQKPTGGGSMVSVYEQVRWLDENIFEPIIEPIIVFYNSTSYQKQFGGFMFQLE